MNLEARALLYGPARGLGPGARRSLTESKTRAIVWVGFGDERLVDIAWEICRTKASKERRCRWLWGAAVSKDLSDRPGNVQVLVNRRWVGRS